MPRLPDINEIQRPQVRPSTNVVQNSAVGVVGNAMSKLGGDVEKMAQAELIKLHEAKAREAEIAMRTAEFELSSEAEQTRLGNVIPKDGEKPFAEQRMEKFDAKAASIAEGLSPTQREMFGQRLAEIRLNHNARVVKHAVIEGEKYKEQVFEGDVASNSQSAAIRWNDPAAVKSSVDAISAAYDKRLEEGYDKDLVKSAKLKALSTTHTAVIGNMLQNGNTEMAKDYYTKNQHQILDQSVGAKITQETGEKKVMTIAADLVGGIPENDPLDVQALYKQMEKELGPLATPAEIKMGRTEISTLANVRRDTLAKKVAEPISMLLSGASLQQVKQSPAFRGLDTEGKNKVIAYAATDKASADSSPTKLAAYYQLKLDDDRMRQSSEAAIVNYGLKHGLGRDMTEQLLVRKKALDNPKEINAVVDTTDFDFAYSAATGDAPKKTDPDYLKKLKYVEDRVYSAQLRGDRALTRPEKQEIIKDAFTEVEVVRNWWPDSSVSAQDLTPDDVAKIVVPAARREGIIASLKAAKPTSTITENDIRAYYYYNTR